MDVELLSQHETVSGCRKVPLTSGAASAPVFTVMHPQEFAGAERIVQDIETAEVTVTELKDRRIVQDDRIEFTITDSAVLFGSPTRGTGW